jgi:hypothetical protein
MAASRGRFVFASQSLNRYLELRATMDRELVDRAQAIRERIVQLRDSL